MQFPVPLAIASSRVQLPTGSYAFEPKYDGWRLAAHGDRARVHTRAGTDVTSRFPEIAAAVATLGDIVVDGELVAAVGTPPRLEFTALQAGPARRKARGVGLYLLAFDLLAADGQDLRALPPTSCRPRKAPGACARRFPSAARAHHHRPRTSPPVVRPVLR